jgi:hypothetical protein
MEPLSAAASVIAIVQITSKIFDSCTNYYLHAKHARDDIRRLRQEIDALQDVLASVLDLTDGDTPGRHTVLEVVSKKGGVLEQCQNELRTVLQKLEPSGSDQKVERLLFRLKWPFSKKDLDVVLSTVERYKSSLALATASEQTYGGQFLSRHESSNYSTEESRSTHNAMSRT